MQGTSLEGMAQELRLAAPLQPPPLAADACRRCCRCRLRVGMPTLPLQLLAAPAISMAAHSSTLSWAALLLACLAVLQQPAAANAYSSDAEALLALKASFTNGDEVFTTWQPGTDACAWKGVSCDTARTVVKL